ncbi:MAG: hypothetical protein JKY55_18565 [Aliivibrio sp.]|uniref:hypothetical protein n=1 Tax=Aliivibrio sp. TaxID=1872443 RepID=UPI001A43B1C9|nr:hypothetical protein [Aliivibrio sp.]
MFLEFGKKNFNLKKAEISTLLLCLFLTCSFSSLGQQPLAGSDDLGRVLPLNHEAGDPQKNKQVGMFYFLWQGAHTLSSKNHDLSKLIASHPEVLNNFDDPHWGTTTAGAYYFWGKPIYGYYKGTDYWVHLKNVQLLADAGVDFLYLDTTNAFHYPEESEALMLAIDTVLKQGRPAPKLVYYTNTKSAGTMQTIYNEFYKPGSPYYYPNTWFYLNGKPLIIGNKVAAKETDYIKFFTFRANQWPNEAAKTNGWPWIEFERPQKVYRNEFGKREVINVSVAQHPNLAESMGGSAFYNGTGNWGRSFRNGSAGDSKIDIKHGYNVQEQWDYAISQNVPYVLITGWNEWIVGRWSYLDESIVGGWQFEREPKAERSLFVDQASPEYSRDIEPTRTHGLNDSYYMQLVANVRKYKGLPANQPLAKQISITNMSDWDKVSTYYWDYQGDTQSRNHPAAIPNVNYSNSTGRNDFVEAKVSSDKDKLYFYAKTTEKITRNSGDNWMNLYINLDRDHSTGWQGFDYRIIGGTKLQKYQNNSWQALSSVSYELLNNQIYYVISRRELSHTSLPINFEFKWSDNMQNFSDPLDWYVNGDTAPGGRFSYVAFVEQKVGK